METCHCLSTLHFIYLHIMSPNSYTQHNFLTPLLKRRFSHTYISSSYTHALSQLINPELHLLLMREVNALILMLLLTSSGTCMSRNDDQVNQKFFCFLFTNWGWHRLIWYNLHWNDQTFYGNRCNRHKKFKGFSQYTWYSEVSRKLENS